MTIHAETEDQAREIAAERYRVDPEAVECYELTEEELVAGEEQEDKGAEPGAVEADDLPEDAGTPVGEGMAAFRVRVRPDFWEQEARDWVSGLMDCFGVLSEVRVQTMGTQVFVRLSCPEPSILIGRQGHTLEALQHVVTRALTTHWPSFPEVVVDVESYKEKKLQRLERAARGAAQRALRFGRPQNLEPMTASERKYIHNALKDMDSIRTVSYGREPNRHVVVEPIGGAAREGATADDPPRRRRDHPGDNRDRGRGGRRDDRGTRPLFRRPVAAAEGESLSGTETQGGTDESLDWRPTFFKPPEATPAEPGEPYPDVEDDLHT